MHFHFDGGKGNPRGNVGNESQGERPELQMDPFNGCHYSVLSYAKSKINEEIIICELKDANMPNSPPLVTKNSVLLIIVQFTTLCFNVQFVDAKTAALLSGGSCIG